MIIGKYTQQPADVLDYDIDYADPDDPFLSSGDSISGVTAVPDIVGLTVVGTVIDSGTKVKAFVSGGANGISYKVTVTVTTLLGRTKQDEIRIRIKDY